MYENVCVSVYVCAVRAHKQQRTKHKLTVFIVSLPSLSRRHCLCRCLCTLICFAPLPNADVIPIQSCHCTQRVFPSLSRILLSLPFSPTLNLSLPLPLPLALPPSVFLHSPGERFGPLLHIFARALKACNVFLAQHVLPLPLRSGAGAAALETFCLRCQHTFFCARAFCSCCLLVFPSSYFPVIVLELDSISPRAESCP